MNEEFKQFARAHPPTRDTATPPEGAPRIFRGTHVQKVLVEMLKNDLSDLPIWRAHPPTKDTATPREVHFALPGDRFFSTA